MTFNGDLSDFEKIMKNHVFCPIFPCGPTKKNMAKNMIFHDFLKFVQIIIKGHPRYVDMF